MEIKLPFVYPPIVDTYSGVASNVSVMMNNRKHNPLIISNHFLITYSKSLRTGAYNWAYYNDDICVSKDLSDKADEIGVVNTIISTLKKSQYVKIILDQYYIEKSECYHKFHKRHDHAIVFGYNSNKSIFHVADNFVDGKFNIIEISYEEIIKATRKREVGSIESFTLDKNFEFDLNLSLIKTLVKSYIDSKCYIDDSELHPSNLKEEVITGLEVYNILIEEYVKKAELFYDVRTFNIMYDHFKVSIMLMDWLCDYLINSEIFERIKYIMEKYKLLRNEMKLIMTLYIKLTIAYSENSKIRLIEKITRLRNKEGELLRELLECI